MNNIDVNVVVGSIANRKLAELKVDLLLIQEACLMALEVTNRVTASQIAARLAKQHGLEVTASYVGKFLATSGIKRVMIHGKSQLVLDHRQLEKLRQEISEKCDEMAAKLETAIDNFKELLDRIASLEKKWQEILVMRQKERELAKQIFQERQTPSRLPQLMQEVKSLREREAKFQKLKEECKQLKREIKTLPLLAKRKTDLEAALAKYRADEKKITDKEATLKQSIARLRERNGWMRLADLEAQIASAKKELEDLNRQINSKRSFLNKILRRKVR